MIVALNNIRLGLFLSPLKTGPLEKEPTVIWKPKSEYNMSRYALEAATSHHVNKHLCF